MNLREKLTNIQVELKAPKNLRNSFGNYMYRNAESIYEGVKPLLDKTKTSLVLEDDVIEVGGRVYIKATATLYDNESDDKFVTSALARESLDKKGMDDSQITGTASSYARKYCLSGMFLLDDTKDADTDEYHNQVNNAEVKAKLKTSKSVDVPTTEESAKELCSEKQVKFIESLIAKRKDDPNNYLSKYGKSSFAELTKAQAKGLIDFLSRE